LHSAGRQVLHPTRLDLNETVQSLAGMLRQLIGEHIDLQIVCNGTCRRFVRT
jgi:hypothetical protein